MFLKIELLVDSYDPRALADSINKLFQIHKARYTVYENGKVKDNLEDLCVNCEPADKEN